MRPQGPMTPIRRTVHLEVPHRSQRPTVRFTWRNEPSTIRRGFPLRTSLGSTARSRPATSSTTQYSEPTPGGLPPYSESSQHSGLHSPRRDPTLGSSPVLSTLSEIQNSYRNDSPHIRPMSSISNRLEQQSSSLPLVSSHPEQWNSSVKPGEHHRPFLFKIRLRQGTLQSGKEL